MGDTDRELVEAQRRSIRNRRYLTNGTCCGCFHCQQTYAADEITDWADGGRTAICPRCGVDAVLSACTNPLTAEFLARVHTRWFEQGAHVASKGRPTLPATSVAVAPRRAG